MITEKELRKSARNGFADISNWSMDLLKDNEKVIFQKVLDLKILEGLYINEGSDFEVFIKRYTLNQLYYFKSIIIEEIETNNSINITYDNNIWKNILDILNKTIEDGA